MCSKIGVQIIRVVILNEIDKTIKMKRLIKLFLVLYLSQTRYVIVTAKSGKNKNLPIVNHCIKTGVVKKDMINNLLVSLVRKIDTIKKIGIAWIVLINQIDFSWKKAKFAKSEIPKMPWNKPPSIKCFPFIKNWYGYPTYVVVASGWLIGPNDNK